MRTNQQQYLMDLAIFLLLLDLTSRLAPYLADLVEYLIRYIQTIDFFDFTDQRSKLIC
jgi:hypothetical protein